MSDKDIIGRETKVDFKNDATGVPAKIDTGADSSAIWASDIHIDDKNRLCFKLFDEDSPYYTGHEYKRKNYTVSRVKSASGDLTIKFKTHFSIKIKDKSIRASFGLCDRSTHTYPILIGRRTIAGKFLVDVTLHEDLVERQKPKVSISLNHQMQKDPQNFYNNFYLKGVSEQ